MTSIPLCVLGGDKKDISVADLAVFTPKLSIFIQIIKMEKKIF